MPLPIDHLVLAVRNLDDAAQTYRRLGFLVGPQNRHPWGTINRLVLLPGAFLELIAIGDASLIPDHAPQQFSFGAAVLRALADGEGLAMVALRSRDAAAEARRFAAEGLGDFAPFSFARAALDPAGAPVTIGFTLAFSEMAAAPDLAFFACQHHNAAMIWPDPPLIHPNGASSLRGIYAVMENPADFHGQIGVIVAQREMRATSRGVSIDTGDGTIDLLTAAALAQETGLDAQLMPSPKFAGYRVSVADPDSLWTMLVAAGFSPLRRGACVVVRPAEAHGTAIVFERA